MTFIPATGFFRHLVTNETDIEKWLCNLLAEPWDGPRQTIPITREPVMQPLAAGTSEIVFPGGPINPVSTCPKTGRTLRLFIERDMSCALLRDSDDPDVLYEVLPAALTIASTIHHQGDALISPLDRQSMPRINLHKRKDGLRWESRFCQVTAEDILPAFAAEMAEMAAIILEAGPIYDPNRTRQLPEGGRYAPFSCWPEIDPEKDLFFQEIEKVLTAAGSLLCEKAGTDEITLRLYRTMESSPWKSRAPLNLEVIGDTMAMSSAMRKSIRELLQHPGLAVPDCYKARHLRDILTAVDARAPASNHDRLTHLEALLPYGYRP